VNAVPDLDKDKRKVAFTFFVDPAVAVHTPHQRRRHTAPAMKSYAARCASSKADGTRQTPSQIETAR
jgi:hypothetical protein